LDIIDQRWKEINENAITNLHLAMTNSVLFIVVENAIAKEIWDTLIKLYEAKSLPIRIFLKKKLYSSNDRVHIIDELHQ